MKKIRFDLDGFINSFKVPFFRTYHKSLLAPPKSTIIGMLCNISLKSQKNFFEILNNDKILVSIIINSIDGYAKDLWSYKTLNSTNRGKSVIQRDKLFNAYYTVYLKLDDSLYEEIISSLKSPKNIPSLGMDDEIVNIKNIFGDSEFNLTKSPDNCIDSIFLDKGFSYRVKVKDSSKNIIIPTFHEVATKFNAFDNNGKFISREPIKESIFNQVEFINCQIEFNQEIENYVDELGNRIVFC